MQYNIHETQAQMYVLHIVKSEPHYIIYTWQSRGKYMYMILFFLH